MNSSNGVKLFEMGVWWANKTTLSSVSELPRLSSWVTDMALGKVLEGMSTVNAMEHLGSRNGKAKNITIADLEQL